MQILNWKELSPKEQKTLLDRPAEAMVERHRVAEIMNQVAAEGDRALAKWTEQFDRVQVSQWQVGREVRARALAEISPPLRQAMANARQNIMSFHTAQKPEKRIVQTQPGVVCEQWPVPIARVGLYIPGGSAPLFSTVLMLAVPAKLAGCGKVVVATPPNANGEVHPAILAACELCGVDEVYAMGGVQAIAALAAGTESVPAVDKIFGPGNAWVTEAKRQVTQWFPQVGVDLPAGPSELFVIADGDADADFVVWDLLSQAEHGADSQVLLVSPSQNLLQAVSQKLAERLDQLERANTVRGALETSRFILCETLTAAVEISNLYAPEHLILQVAEPRRLLSQITNAGSVFIGPWSPESAGDYASGTNHVLPTSGAAKFSGGVSLHSFYKFMTVQELSAEGLRALAPTIEAMAWAEGLECHARATSIRREKLEAKWG